MRITFTKNQWQRISELSGNGGLLVLGSLVIPFLTDKQNSLGLILGIAISLGLW